MNDEIQELKEKLSEEIAVKKSEVLRNSELKEYNTKLELLIETQSKIIEKYATKIARLQEKLKKIITF
jgi:hypothetical protein|tara:strand:+ start:213 stop:416 length:204 start_codon:yes stop_codon:yes gene_type:complete